MTVSRSLFSSATCEWETPPDLFAKLDAEFGFGLDVCATAENAKCERFYTPRRMDSVYCSPACRQAAYRQRKAA